MLNKLALLFVHHRPFVLLVLLVRSWSSFVDKTGLASMVKTIHVYLGRLKQTDQLASSTTAESSSGEILCN